MEQSVHARVKNFLLTAREVVPKKKAKVLCPDEITDNCSEQQIKQKRRNSMERPKIFLTPDFVEANSWIHLMDVQHLLLRTLGGPQFNARTRWCRLLRPAKLKKVIVVIVEQLDRESAISYLPNTLAHFDIRIGLDPSLTFGCSVLDELVYAPVTSNRLAKFSVPSSVDAKENGKSVSVSRTALLLSASQMLAEGFPLPPPDGVDANYYQDYRFLTASFNPVTDFSPMFAVDCEMCLTSAGLLELTRISVVDEELQCVLDMLVKPCNPIVDYLTQYSGITSSTLANVTHTVCDAQEALEKLLPPDAILCGHSLSSDLHALKVFHPYVVDTSVIYNLSGTYNNKSSLKKLAECFLGVEIQSESRFGHCSEEDALATMRLVKLKLSRDLTFGDFAAADKNNAGASVATSYSQSLFTQSAASLGLLARYPLDTSLFGQKQTFYRHVANGRFYESLFAMADQCNRSAALISFDWPPPEASPQRLHLVRCIKDKHVAKFARRVLNGSNGDSPFLTFVQFLGYGASQTVNETLCYDSDESKETKLLCRLDKRLSRVLASTGEKSLFILLATGRTKSQELQNAPLSVSKLCNTKLGLCCVKIT